MLPVRIADQGAYIHNIISVSGCGAVGSAGGLGPSGRRFETCHLDQKSVDFVGGFFIQADRLGISSRFSVYIIAALVRRISSHLRCVYLYRLDEIQWLCH